MTGKESKKEGQGQKFFFAQNIICFYSLTFILQKLFYHKSSIVEKNKPKYGINLRFVIVAYYVAS